MSWNQVQEAEGALEKDWAFFPLTWEKMKIEKWENTKFWDEEVKKLRHVSGMASKCCRKRIQLFLFACDCVLEAVRYLKGILETLWYLLTFKGPIISYRRIKDKTQWDKSSTTRGCQYYY